MKIKPLEFKETYDSTIKTCWEAKGVTYKYEITQTDLGFISIKLFSKDIQNNLKYPTFQLMKYLKFYEKLYLIKIQLLNKGR